MFKHQKKKKAANGKSLGLQFTLNGNIQHLSPDKVLSLIARLNYHFLILMNVALKHSGSIEDLLNMLCCCGCFVLHCFHGCFTLFYILLNTSISTGLFE